MQLKSPAEF